MARELAIVRAEMSPSVPHSFQTLVFTHGHLGGLSLVIGFSGLFALLKRTSWIPLQRRVRKLWV
jgi:hypothetical protein